jgi:hypothetical protein
VERGEEIPCSLIVARSDTAELLEFAEEILDQVSRLVERLIKLAGGGSVLPRRDDGGFSGLRQRLEDALIGIVGFVGDQHPGGHLRQQRIGADEIMGLSRGQQEAQRIAERVDQSMDFSAQSAFAAADRLIIVFFGRQRCAGGRVRWCCQSLHIRCRPRWPDARRDAATPLSWPSG